MNRAMKEENGDGRCDSPSNNTKYCAYSFLDQSSDKAAEPLVNHGRVTGYWNKVEQYAFEKLLDKIQYNEIFFF